MNGRMPKAAFVARRAPSRCEDLAEREPDDVKSWMPFQVMKREEQDDEDDDERRGEQGRAGAARSKRLEGRRRPSASGGSASVALRST